MQVPADVHAGGLPGSEEIGSSPDAFGMADRYFQAGSPAWCESLYIPGIGD